MPGNIASRGQGIAQIGRPVLARRRPDRDELDLPVRGGLFDIGREVQATGFAIGPDQILEARLVDGNAALLRMSILPASVSRQTTSLPT